jgi:hypothetical protein
MLTGGRVSRRRLRVTNLKRIFFSTLAAFLLLLGAAAAEPTPMEQRIREVAQQHPQFSVVFMEVKLVQEGKEHYCPEISVKVVSDQESSTSFFTQNAPSFFGRMLDGATYGGVAFLAPGTYTIVSVLCKLTARLNGKFARFRVGPNEIINIGCLVVDFKKSPVTLLSARTFDGRTSVEAIGTKAIRSITERVPSVFPKATKRYMTPNAATSGKRAS